MDCWTQLHMQVMEEALKELDRYILRVLEETLKGVR